jgi:ribonuclease P protein component
MVVQARARDEAPPASAAAALNASEGAATSDHAGPPRVGITVSRKVGNSVQRNRARRRLRAAAREALPEAGLPGMDYVLIGRAGTLDRNYTDLLADLRQAVAKLNRPGKPKQPDAGPPRSGPRRRKRSGGPDSAQGTRRATGDRNGADG